MNRFLQRVGWRSRAYVRYHSSRFVIVDVVVHVNEEADAVLLRFDCKILLTSFLILTFFAHVPTYRIRSMTGP